MLPLVSILLITACTISTSLFRFLTWSFLNAMRTRFWWHLIIYFQMKRWRSIRCYSKYFVYFTKNWRLFVVLKVQFAHSIPQIWKWSSRWKMQKHCQVVGSNRYLRITFHYQPFCSSILAWVSKKKIRRNEPF